ncbi:MAG: hypothetical protein WA364_09575 [Candidatus Nitrosopolaris sp.]
MTGVPCPVMQYSWSSPAGGHPSPESHISGIKLESCHEGGMVIMLVRLFLAAEYPNLYDESLEAFTRVAVEMSANPITTNINRLNRFQLPLSK